MLPGHKLISANYFVKNLKAYGHIPSLVETPLPDFQPEDTDVVRRRKALDIEWTYPRKQLNMFVSYLDGWEPVGSLSLLNPFGYPYRIYSLLDMFTDNLALEMGNGGAIAVQIQDVGTGYLAEQDKLTIHGSCSEESFLSYEYPQQIYYVSGSGTVTPPPTDPRSPEPTPDPTPSPPPPTSSDSSISNSSAMDNRTSIGK